MSKRTLSWSSRLGALGTALTLMSAGACNKADSSTPPDGAQAAADAAPAAEVKEERVYPDPPPPTEPRPVNFPEVQNFELPNALKVYVVENHEVPLVNVQLVVKAGELDNELLASMTTSMLTEGTAGRKGLTKAKLDAKIEQVGGSLSAGASTFDSRVSTQVLKKDLKMALGLLNDVATKPRLPEDALGKIKEQVKAGMKMAKSEGASLGQRLLSMKLFPQGHPYGRAFPTDEEIDAVTLDNIRKFHQTYYNPGNAYVILSGDIDKAEAEKLLKKTFGYWKPTKEKLPEHPLAQFSGEDYQKALPAQPEVHIVDRQSISAEIFMGNLSLPRNSADWITMSAVNNLFGGLAGSRLFSDIRETRRLTYNVGSYVQSSKAAGAFVISTQTKKVDEMFNALFEHIDRIRTTDPSEEEFRSTIDNMARSFPLQIETARQVAGKVGHMLTFDLPSDYYQKYRDEVLAIKAENFKTMAQKYIHEVPVIVIVGKRAKIEKQIARVEALKGAKVFYYDQNLKMVR